MAVLPHPPELPGQPSDKIQHIAAFLTLALLASWAFTATQPWKLLTRLSLFGAAIELFQMIPALNRDADAVDWLADTVTVLVVLLIVSWFRRRSRAGG